MLYQIIKYRYEHDHTGRVTSIQHQTEDHINNIISPNYTIVENEYDERDFLAQKRLHRRLSGIMPDDPENYLQYVDYRYNIRSWLTDINNINFIAQCTQGSRTTPDAKQSEDLFSMKLSYQGGGGGVSGLFNGNISSISWKSGCADQTHTYGFSYDGLDRITRANYMRTDNLGGLYSLDYVNYNLDGNITSLRRAGRVANNSYVFDMDELTYTYHPLIPNHLAKIEETGVNSAGFKATAATNALAETYLYDDAGNMKEDKHKGASFDYHFFNLPSKATFASGSIEWTYRADGQKLSKKSSGNTKEYCNGIEYNNGQLEAIYHEEGRVTKDGGSWLYEYAIKDHLGNSRVIFADIDNDDVADVLQSNHYYPFGMELDGMGITPTLENAYQYNGKEINKEFGLNWYCYGARMYSPAEGRFVSVDPIAEEFAFVSPFNYAENEPVRHIDLHGLQKFDLMGHHDVVNQQSFESGGAEQVKKDQKIFTEAFLETAVVAAPLALPGPEDVIFGALALTKVGGTVIKFADDAVSGLKGLFKKGEDISNPIPDEMARVIPDGDFEVTTLGRPGAKDVFVTDAKDIEGLNSTQIADKLTIPESESGFQIFTFKTPKEGIASPVNRSDPGFIGGGRTAGGAKEFVIPNQSIPADATKRVIKD